MQLDNRAIIDAVGELLAEERAQRIALEARISELINVPLSSEFSDQEFSMKIYEAIGIKVKIGDN